ncbi:MAG: hypothetical protein IJO83_00885 [Clostridia bacterium]|nr:hypothetical protein [Clostridia bacterium]
MDARDEINNYIICEEINGALLLTGQWGCGKTHLVKEMADKFNKENKYAVLIISLFGIDSLESLSHKIKESIFWIQTLNKSDNKIREKASKAKDTITHISSIFSEHSKIAKSLNTVLSIDFYNFINIENRIECWMGEVKVYKELILVFDDLERSKLNKVELLGAINNYLENKKIKTILIADENKIEEENYYKFKEKVVFRTVQLIPKYYDVVNCLVAGYHQTMEGYREFLNKNKSLITQVFIESQSQNIRTLKAIFMDFERVFDVMKTSNIPEDYIRETLYSFSAISFEYKADNYKEDEYGYTFADVATKSKYTDFNKNSLIVPSLKDWIVKGNRDTETVRCELEKYCEPKEESYEYKFLGYDFWALDYNVISKGLPQALDSAYKGLLTCDDLISLIQKITAMKIYKIELPSKVDYSKIEDGLRLREEMIKEETVVETPRRTFITNETIKEMDEDLQQLYKSVEWYDERQCFWTNRSKLKLYFKDDDSVSIHDLKNMPINSFDDELLSICLNKYKQSDILHKREITIMLTNICFFRNEFSTNEETQKTQENIEKFINELYILSDNEKDKMIKACVKLSIEQLQTYLKQVKK